MTKLIMESSSSVLAFFAFLIGYFFVGTNANANFAQFDNFPKSSSADFGAFNSTGASKTTSVSKPSQPSADKYAALADLDNIFGNQQGKARERIMCGDVSTLLEPLLHLFKNPNI